MKDVNCPYCGFGQDINHDDGYGYEEDRLYQQTCGECDKVFAYNTYISFDHTALKADCLNGADHKYEPITTSPVEYTQMRCVDCGGTRPCTPEEMKQVLERYEKTQSRYRKSADRRGVSNQ